MMSSRSWAERSRSLLDRTSSFLAIVDTMSPQQDSQQQQQQQQPTLRALFRNLVVNVASPDSSINSGASQSSEDFFDQHQLFSSLPLPGVVDEENVVLSQLCATLGASAAGAGATVATGGAHHHHHHQPTATSAIAAKFTIAVTVQSELICTAASPRELAPDAERVLVLAASSAAVIAAELLAARQHHNHQHHGAGDPAALFVSIAEYMRLLRHSTSHLAVAHDAMLLAQEEVAIRSRQPNAQNTTAARDAMRNVSRTLREQQDAVARLRPLVSAQYLLLSLATSPLATAPTAFARRELISAVSSALLDSAPQSWFASTQFNHDAIIEAANGVLASSSSSSSSLTCPFALACLLWAPQHAARQNRQRLAAAAADPTMTGIDCATNPAAQALLRLLLGGASADMRWPPPQLGARCVAQMMPCAVASCSAVAFAPTDAAPPLLPPPAPKLAGAARLLLPGDALLFDAASAVVVPAAKSPSSTKKGATAITPTKTVAGGGAASVDPATDASSPAAAFPDRPASEESAASTLERALALLRSHFPAVFSASAAAAAAASPGRGSVARASEEIGSCLSLLLNSEATGDAGLLKQWCDRVFALMSGGSGAAGDDAAAAVASPLFRQNFATLVSLSKDVAFALLHAFHTVNENEQQQQQQQQQAYLPRSEAVATIIECETSDSACHVIARCCGSLAGSGAAKSSAATAAAGGVVILQQDELDRWISIVCGRFSADTAAAPAATQKNTRILAALLTNVVRRSSATALTSPTKQAAERQQQQSEQPQQQQQQHQNATKLSHDSLCMLQHVASLPEHTSRGEWLQLFQALRQALKQ